MSSIQSSVVLPSIHEMFPEYHLIKDPVQPIHTRPVSHRQTMSLSAYSAGSPSFMANSRRQSAAPITQRLHTMPENIRTNSPTHNSFRRGRPKGTHGREGQSEDILLSEPSSFPRGRPKSTLGREGQPDSPVFSFDVLLSDPSSSSLRHIASSATFSGRGGSSSGYTPHAEISNGSAPVFRVSVAEPSPNSHSSGNSRARRPIAGPSSSPRIIESSGPHTSSSPGPAFSTIISFPVSGPHSQSRRGRSPDDPDNVSDGELSGSNNGKKHVCPTCSKRFNRPSSLRIHVNTHTGETPFRCPWPNCAREFNVNSNMRRHYRNHTTPGFSRPQANDNRRRRKRGSSRGVVFVPSPSRPEAEGPGAFPTPPGSSLPTNEDSDGMSDVDGQGSFQDDYEDELDSLPDEASPVYERTERPYSRGSDVSDKPSYDPRSFSRYSQSHVRGNPAAPGHHPSPQDHRYSPSAPYLRSFTDSNVSTALRPAFHTSPSRLTKEEPMSDIR